MPQPKRRCATVTIMRPHWRNSGRGLVIISILLLARLSMAASDSATADLKGITPVPLTAAQLQQDVQFAFDAIDEVHPNAYYTVSRAQILQ
jgi:hypothetical protein